MVKLTKITASPLCIPFRVAFKHASAERSETATIWVQVTSSDGLAGYGEGCPREYVTGETVETALGFVDQVSASLLDEVTDIASLNEWARSYAARIDVNPAAWCAVELALLDLLGKQSAQSIESLLGYPELSGMYQYSAVLGDSGEGAFAKQLKQYSDAGFRDFKLKVSGDRNRDRSRIAMIIDSAGAKVRVRLDANSLWTSPVEAVGYIRGLNAPLYAVEEPLKAGDFVSAASMADALGIPVILDESFTNISQVSSLAEHPARWILNLRVSKLGGIIRSLSAVEVARNAGLRIVIGAQVGETSLLTRAALTIASASRDLLIAQEGAFGTLLLEQDVCAEPLMFGPGGRLDAGDRFREQAGLGVPVDPDLLRRAK